MEIINKKFKENSHQKNADIKEMQAKHKDDLVQPREGGEINPDYLRLYGCKNLNVSDYDARRMAEKYPRTLSRVVDQVRRDRERK